MEIESVFPEARDPASFGVALHAFMDKFNQPSKYNSVLGFGDGGLVTQPTIAALAELGKPELVMPLDRFEKTYMTKGREGEGSTIIQELNLTLQSDPKIEVDATWDMSNPDKFTRSMKPLLRGVLRELLNEAEFQGAVKRTSRKAARGAVRAA
jgi:hypothetical protein